MIGQITFNDKCTIPSLAGKTAIMGDDGKWTFEDEMVAHYLNSIYPITRSLSPACMPCGFNAICLVGAEMGADVKLRKIESVPKGAVS